MKKNSQHLQNFKAKFTATAFSNVFWIWFKFSRNISEFRESWRSGLRSWRNEGGKRFEPVSGSILFWKNTDNAVKLNNSPHSPQKYVRNTRWKFFLPHFMALLTKIHRQTSTWVWNESLKTCHRDISEWISNLLIFNKFNCQKIYRHWKKFKKRYIQIIKK